MDFIKDFESYMIDNLSNMRPLTPCYNKVNGLARYTEFNTQNMLVSFPIGKTLSNFKHLLLSKLVMAGKLSLLGIPLCASFSRHIRLIVSHSANAEMIGPYAYPIIAFMHNAKPLWDRAIGNLPSNPMGTKRFPISSIDADFTIAVVSRWSIPQPTSISLSNFYSAPKAFFNVFHGRVLT